MLFNQERHLSFEEVIVISMKEEIWLTRLGMRTQVERQNFTEKSNVIPYPICQSIAWEHE